MRRTLALVALGLSMTVSACAVTGDELPLQSASMLKRDSSTINDDYLLAVGDEVLLTVYGEPEITKSYKIAPDGFIEMPLIGRVQSTGMTIAQLSADVQDRLGAGFLRQPSVAGSIQTYRPFYVLGEVNKPGEYAYRSGLTLDAAIAMAGGYTYRAQGKYVFIHAEKVEGEVKAEAGSTLVIRPGDTLRVAERFF
jgi:protein involved in polysaccharide export with SLBB domain